MSKAAFPNYTEIPRRLPKAGWWLLRIAAFALTLFQLYLLTFQPEPGLVLFWQVLIPLLPLSFAVVPGLWRNLCPMAFLNQLPRELGFSRQQPLPESGKKLALYVSIVLFLLFVLARKPWLNHDGPMLAAVLTLALVLSLVAGWWFQGRSGWCGTFCPLAPLQKAYGYAPLILIPNGYCEPCLGCQKNCYDFNPKASLFSDLDDPDPWWRDKRLFFMALLPGLIQAFFTTRYPETEPAWRFLYQLFLPMAFSLGAFLLLRNLLGIPLFKLLAFFSMVALGLFYWHGAPLFLAGLETLFGFQAPTMVTPWLRGSVIFIATIVLLRGWWLERLYRQGKQSQLSASLGKGMATLQSAVAQTSGDGVREVSTGTLLTVEPEKTLLDALEAAELPILPGCRMGMCGSDPIVITEGMENLEPPSEHERETLQRLGLEGKARLACCCKPTGAVSIDLSQDPKTLQESHATPLTQEKTGPHYVIVGNGIAGTTTAEQLRRLDPDCRISLITREPYPFYNRMALEKLIHGRHGLEDLYLLPRDWDKHQQIELWLNTRVDKLDADGHILLLGTGDYLRYDKLILATGADAFVPDNAQYQQPGIFSLRDADHGLHLRNWIQHHATRKVAILGGGVLGIEATQPFVQMGLEVHLIHTGPWLMNHLLDETGAALLTFFLESQGIHVHTGCGIEHIPPREQRLTLLLDNDDYLEVDLLLLCIGIRSRTQLARNAGLKVERGVVVNEHMQTSHPDIYCVGDAAQAPDGRGGLWSVGLEQGKRAAEAICTGTASPAPATAPPVVQLKVPDIDVKCFGSLPTDAHVVHITSETMAGQRWVHIALDQGRIVGGVFINETAIANQVIASLDHETNWDARRLHQLVNGETLEPVS